MLVFCLVPAFSFAAEEIKPGADEPKPPLEEKEKKTVADEPKPPVEEQGKKAEKVEPKPTIKEEDKKSGASEPTGEEQKEAGTVELSASEQNKKAMAAFQKILDLTQEADRSAVLPQIEAAFRDIIDKYPKASITQECYWRLMTVYLTDYSPPSFEKAEAVREEFIKKYPDSRTKDLIDDTLSNGYYMNSKWEKLLKFYTPAVKRFIKESAGKEKIDRGSLSRPLEMFMYSEAKLNLGDLAEAEKGYKIVIALFPDSKESATSKKRLEDIKSRKSKKE